MGGLDETTRQAVERLTPRERECLRLVAQHLRSKEIGRRLNISSHTVDGHVSEARRRLGARDRREAALMVVAVEESAGAAAAALPAELVSVPAAAAPAPPTVAVVQAATPTATLETASRGATFSSIFGAQFGPAGRLLLIVVWAFVLGLLSLGAVVASHGFTSAVQAMLKSDPSPPRT